jgi:type I restriction enzyme S subunit
MKVGKVALGELARVRTGKLDANASSPNGKYPFFTCAINPLRIDTFSYECECVLVAGNGDLNVKYHNGRFDAYQRTYIVEPISESLDCRYLYHFLDSYLTELRKLSIGGVIKYIKLGNLTDAQIPLPPLEEQRRIAAILDKIQNQIAKHELAIESLRELNRGSASRLFLFGYGPEPT